MNRNHEIESNLRRADASLQAAKVLFAANLFNDATSRAYYAAFHAATALLLSENLNFGSHTGVLRAVSLNFVKTGKMPRNYGRDLNWLAELRQVADYGETRDVTASDTERAIETSEQFLNQVRQLLNNI